MKTLLSGSGSAEPSGDKYFPRSSDKSMLLHGLVLRYPEVVSQWKRGKRKHLAVVNESCRASVEAGRRAVSSWMLPGIFTEAIQQLAQLEKLPRVPESTRG